MTGISPKMAPGAALMFIAAATAATAAEFCVTCTEPDATYTCEVRGLNVQAASGMQGQMLCIKQLAAESGHKTCSVGRNAPAGCAGPLRIMNFPESAAVAPAPGPKPGVPGAIAAVPAERPVEAASKGPLETAGEGVTAVAKKSWSCVTSWFKDC